MLADSLSYLSPQPRTPLLISLLIYPLTINAAPMTTLITTTNHYRKSTQTMLRELVGM
jgi:hypothetical protein